MNTQRHDRPPFSLRRTLFGLLLIVLASSLGSSRTPSTLERVIESGALHVLSRNGPSNYYEGPGGFTGFEYSLLQGFTEQLGVKLIIHDQDNLNLMLSMVEHSEISLAAAGLTITESRLKRVQFTESYLDVTQQLIFNRDATAPETIADLIGKDILVIAGSSHVERLQELQREHPNLAWREQVNMDMIDLIEMVHRSEIDYAIIDSNAYQINRSTFPKARVAFTIGEAQPLGWAFPISRDKSLFNQAQKYIRARKKDGTITALAESSFDYDNHVSTGGALLFTERLEERLPKWEQYIKTSATTFNLDWELLAAISYQESHWNPKARSRTGVRGFMMLTRTTAKEMGVKNRSDAAQSIHGGSKYFSLLYGRMPKSIQDQDRIWMTLAAYNLGMGHIEDARVLTQSQGGDPDIWVDVRERLPLLAKRKFYRNTKHGYTRGWEAVTYVRNIRQYRDIIVWHDQQQQRRDNLLDNSYAKDSENTDPTIEENLEIDLPMLVL